MFIAFEGIDGSGKTTLSNRVADHLARLGHPVRHARAGGELQAATARRVRELTRDSKLLEMSPEVEFFLNLARDAQQIHEVILPALGRGEVVITDRYLYSQRALSGAGRGLRTESLQGSLDLAAQGLWPDLVILVDVDPELARLRKRLGKILGGEPDRPDSRKNLAGAGLSVRLRECYLELARQDPTRWRVFENNHQPLHVLEQNITDAVLARLEHRELRAVRPLPSLRPDPVSLENLETAFFSLLDDLESREPALAIFLLSGIPGPRAHQRRLRSADRQPELVARSLHGLFDLEALALRAVLKDWAPRQVADSLGIEPAQASMALRQELFARARPEVLAGLKHNDSPEAWALRDRALCAGGLDEVLVSLAGLEGPRTWALRASGLERGLVVACARSLSGLSGERADGLRQQLAQTDRLAVLKSLSGVDSPFAKAFREELFQKAPKVVLRSLAGLETPYAYALRERAAPVTKEALDSVDGLDSELAWSLRERYAANWPATALSSLRQLGGSPRARLLIERVLALCPGRIAVLRNAYAVISRAAYQARDGAERPQPADKSLFLLEATAT